ncbi:MAG: F0F1 ATP synthase subunit A [Planctomycetota bacterium]
MSDPHPVEVAAKPAPKGGDAHAGEPHGFSFDALNNSHNQPYPAIEWVHGKSPQLILNLAGYADRNLAALAAKPGFATTQPRPELIAWAKDYQADLKTLDPADAKTHQALLRSPEDLARAMTLADSDSWLGSLPRTLSFFNHQTFWSTIALTLFAAVLFIARRKPGQHCPTSRLQHMLEAVVLFVRDEIVRPNIKTHGVDGWSPFFASLFCAIVACNLFGLVPLFGTATGNIFVTAAFSLVILVLMVFMGVKENGVGAFWIKLVPVHWSWNPLMMMLWFFLFIMEVA